MFNGYKDSSLSAGRQCYQHLKERNFGKNIGNVTIKLYHKKQTQKPNNLEGLSRAQYSDIIDYDGKN